MNGDDALDAPVGRGRNRSTTRRRSGSRTMTMLTAGMLRDRQTNTADTTTRAGAFRRLRSSLIGGRRLARRAAAGRATSTLLHDVALGGTAASAANRYLESLATGRRA
jgi:hypothetical protein